MPYPGIREEDTGKMDRCVSGVMEKGKSKDRAIAICHTAIVGNGSLLNFQAATDDEILSLQASLGESVAWASADIPTSEIWKFTGACLARAEVNSNGDGLTDEGIEQLASTIRLMPLTLEHNRKRPIGIFTRGYTNDESTECLVDGFLWAGHFPTEADEVRTGIRRLSMDAEAQLAVCSICGAAFSRTAEYCEHVRTRARGAVRWLYDLQSVAGGAVRHPAGTGTVFPGREGFTVISHHEGNRVEKPRRTGVVEIRGGNMKVICSECGHEHEIVTEAEKIQAELDAKIEELEGLKSEADDKQAEIDDLQASVTGLESEVEAEKVVVDRFAELAAEAGVEFAREALSSLRKVDDDVYKTLKSMASRLGKQEDTPIPQPPQDVVASEGDPPQAGDTWTVKV